MDGMIIFTNGCFDTIHIGHIRLLKWAYGLGDRLIVGLNSDESVRRLKGEGRPIYPLRFRVEFLLSIKYVGGITVFGEDTPIETIRTLKPDIIVKGADYKAEDVVGYGIAMVRICPSRWGQ